ncbi:MAG TPA: DUF1501 domain-containing protein [Bryobacteraceae bacterium]|jgi:hypothetical protein
MPHFDRRDVLRMGALPFLPLSHARASSDVSCIFLMLVGGPSQLDTWDPKPDAPSHIRSPFRPIRTNVPGVEISELFPRMARQADKYALIRGCYHTAEPIHEAGHQLMQTGRLCEDQDVEHPHIGSVVASLSASKHVLLPGPIGHTGGSPRHGQTAGSLGSDHDPRATSPDLRAESQSTRERYGRNAFGQSCLAARRLVESKSARFVTINMFDTVFHQTTWDMHGSAPFSSMDGYRDHVGPMFDRAYSALLEDLHHRGLLSCTLVVATGEFGRSPKINPAGGRDHWPECWTMLMAGGGVKGGQIIGASDKIAAEPRDRPVSPQEVAATIYHALGVPLSTQLSARGIPIVDPGIRPVSELFG